MKLKVNYDELSSVLGYVNTILGDKSVDEKMKNIIFSVSEKETRVIGYSPLTFSRTQLNDVEVDGVSDVWEFQVKAAELNKIVSSFSSLFKTKVTSVEFEKADSKIAVKLTEEAIKEEDSRLSQVSKFAMDNVPLAESIKREINLEFPEDTSSIISGDLLLFIDSLFPLMNNDTASSLVSKLNFADDYIFVITTYMSAFMKNKLPDAFKDLTLSYSSVNFLSKLCNSAESIDVEKTDKHLCIESGSTQAFIKYQHVKVKHEQYVKRMAQDNGIVLDRLYLKDVLKRMQVTSLDGVMKVVDEGLEVSNDGFAQVIPINKTKGDVEGVKFKASVPILLKTIVGNDSVFPDQLFIYFVKSGSGYIMYLKDSTGAWFATTQVRA